MSCVSATVSGPGGGAPAISRNRSTSLSAAASSGSNSAADAGKRPRSSRADPARSSHRERCQNVLMAMSATPSPNSTMPSSPRRGGGASAPAKRRQAASEAGRAWEGYESGAEAPPQMRASSSSA